MKEKKSPFVLHDDSRIVYETIGKPSFSRMRTLFESGETKSADLKIMEYLHHYGVLNAFLVTCLLTKDISRCNGNFCRERLSRLVKSGRVLRFRIVNRDSFDIEHASSYLYILSERGRLTSSTDETELSAAEALRRVAYNQFIIMLSLSSYSPYLKIFNQYGRGGYDGELSFRKDGILLTFHLLSLRGGTEWKSRYLERLRKMQSSSFTCSSYLIICESELQALAAERHRKTDVKLTDMQIIYVCDSASVSEGTALSHLIRVLPDNNYASYEEFKLLPDIK